MPDTRDKDDRHHNESCNDVGGSVAGKAGDVGHVLSKASTDIAGLGTDLLGGLAGAIDGLLGGLRGEMPSTRRTEIHPWNLPAETLNDRSPDEDLNKPHEYDESDDRIH
jgi:hypothetical protein